jgi:hypothetical protein
LGARHVHPTAEELEQQPRRLAEDARHGTSDVVTVQGEPVMLTLPLGKAAGTSEERLALAVTLCERDVLTLGLAAKVAGLSHGQMIGEWLLTKDARAHLVAGGRRHRTRQCSHCVALKLRSGL